MHKLPTTTLMLATAVLSLGATGGSPASAGPLVPRRSLTLKRYGRGHHGKSTYTKPMRHRKH